MNTTAAEDVLILAIESSCDETAASVVKNGRTVLSNVISSQIALHTLYGGVVPEIASRKHIEKINQVIEAALKEADMTLDQMTAIAVTYGPGLVGALLVGVAEAKAIAYAAGKPLIGVHHIEGHVSANFIENPDLEPPFVCLIVSGGHTHLVVVKDYGEFEILGRTRDDAAGEAFDKVARAVGLGYPGGPKVDKAAKEGKNVSIISVGWDPGMFSLNRLYANAILPQGKDYTFWGKGVSQGHSDAVRRIEGVADARQYTIPVKEALDSVRAGENPDLTTRQKHTRECFVVLEEGADKERIEEEIKTMPNYFADYDTTVHFISQEEMERDHRSLPHGGFVIRSGKTGWDLEHNHVIEYSLKLDSNPEFTSSVIVACARAAYRMKQEGMTGCKTILDLPPAYLSSKSGEELRKELL